ncbi:hypothetical protein [Gelidibacter gilvus]|uniref:Uncharacterized protein n=1 Tax=Gelidibacter gilvus TaxID=59602 RepID=A0A4Q0XID5_9FLAO|nr:hypothetical protein [Gelidibacter gilvus]RXJ51220.1 hypothetical protein ESZ48_04930 [Gelidibacter gilvus]
MAEKTPIINILTYNLPYKLARQIYNEYQSRLREANYIINEVNRYKDLQEHIQTVELLLALSIFHKRVIANLDGAVKFYGTVTNQSEAVAISIGSYDLTNDEKNKILGLLINYRNLLDNYGISDEFMEYYTTKDFLLRLKNLKSDFEYARNENKKNKGKNNDKTSEDDLPF